MVFTSYPSMALFLTTMSAFYALQTSAVQSRILIVAGIVFHAYEQPGLLGHLLASACACLLDMDSGYHSVAESARPQVGVKVSHLSRICGYISAWVVVQGREIERFRCLGAF
jgi:hypothetical protein